jgi:hypothetical protein
MAGVFCMYEKIAMTLVGEQSVVYDEPPVDVSEEVTNSYIQGLPPYEWRLPQFRTRGGIAENKIETPVDEWGLVDVDELVRRVKATMLPGYTWGGGSDRHHIGWPHAGYTAADASEADNIANSFRDLPMNKIWIPRIFHNWIHVVTSPPPMPSREVMSAYIDEWLVVRGFFNSVRDTMTTMRYYERIRLERAKEGNAFTTEQERLLKEDLLRRFGGITLHAKLLEDMPLERWPISHDMLVLTAAGQVGDIVMRGWRRRTKDVQRPLEELQKVA